MQIDPTALVTLIVVIGALCICWGVFIGRMTATPRLVLDPVEAKMQRRRTHLDEVYAEQSRDECPLAEE